MFRRKRARSLPAAAENTAKSTWQRTDFHRESSFVYTDTSIIFVSGTRHLAVYFEHNCDELSGWLARFNYRSLCHWLLIDSSLKQQNCAHKRDRKWANHGTECAIAANPSCQLRRSTGTVSLVDVASLRLGHDSGLTWWRRAAVSVAGANIEFYTSTQMKSFSANLVFANRLTQSDWLVV